MAVDMKDLSDAVHAHKSPTGHQNPPSLTGKQALACDMDDSSDRSSRLGGGRFFQSKLLPPLAVWILVAIAGLSFLSLMASLNRTMLTLDSLIKLEQQRLNDTDDDGAKVDQPTRPPGGSKASDWLALPSWMSLEPLKAGRQPPGGVQDLQSLMDEVFQAATGQIRNQDGPIRGGSIIISSDAPLKDRFEPAEALPEGLMLGPMLELVGDGHSPMRKPLPLMVPKMEKLNTNFHDEKPHRPHHVLQRPTRPTAAEIEALDKTIEGLLSELGDQEAQKMFPPTGLDPAHYRKGMPQPRYPPHERPGNSLPGLLVPIGPLEPPANQPQPLDEVIPPMFGRPSLTGPLVIALDGELPNFGPMQANKQASPYEMRPMADNGPLPGLDQLLAGQSDDLFPENRPAATERPDKGATPIGMQDLFKIFFGPPPPPPPPTHRGRFPPLGAEQANLMREAQPLGKLVRPPEADIPRGTNGRLFPDEDRMGAKDFVSMILAMPSESPKSKSDESRLFPSGDRLGVDADLIAKMIGHSGERQADKSLGEEKQDELELEHPDDKEAEELAQTFMNMMSSPQFSGSTLPARVGSSASTSSTTDMDESTSSPALSTVTLTSQTTAEHTAATSTLPPTRQPDLVSTQKIDDFSIVTPGVPISTTSNPDEQDLRFEFNLEYPVNFRPVSEVLEESLTPQTSVEGPSATSSVPTQSTLAPSTFDYSTSSPDRHSSTQAAPAEAASKQATTERPLVSPSQGNSTKSPFRSFIERADNFIKGNLLNFRRFIAE